MQADGVEIANTSEIGVRTGEKRMCARRTHTLARHTTDSVGPNNDISVPGLPATVSADACGRLESGLLPPPSLPSKEQARVLFFRVVRSDSVLCRFTVKEICPRGN